MTLGLTFFKPGAPGLEPFYTLHVGWPGPTAKREKRLLQKKNNHFAKQKCTFLLANDFGANFPQDLPMGPL